MVGLFAGRLELHGVQVLVDNESVDGFDVELEVLLCLQGYLDEPTVPERYSM